MLTKPWLKSMLTDCQLVQTVKFKYAWQYDHDYDTGFPEYSGIT